MTNRVLELRLERLWRQRTLARKARLEPSTISLIERGLRNASPITQEKIARAFGVPREEVFPSAPAEVAS